MSETDLDDMSTQARIHAVVREVQNNLPSDIHLSVTTCNAVYVVQLHDEVTGADVPVWDTELHGAKITTGDLVQRLRGALGRLTNILEFIPKRGDDENKRT